MNKTLKIETEDDDGDELTVEIPMKRIVCGRCDGTGTHVNPSIDGNGISPEQFDEDPDFRDDYFSGRFDVPCEECHGKNVVEIADLDRCTPAQIQAWEDHLDSLRPCPIQEMERRMGA